MAGILRLQAMRLTNDFENRKELGWAQKTDPTDWASSFMSHDAAHGALPTLRAATALDVASGSYVAPSRLFQLKGEPVLVQVPKPARDETAARTLWEVSRKLTGVAFAGFP